jgi:hypothetical protein
VATQVSGGRDGPRRFDGDARMKRHAHGHRAASATLRSHRDVSILRQAWGGDVAKDTFASRTEATDNVAWSLLAAIRLTPRVKGAPIKARHTPREG